MVTGKWKVQLSLQDLLVEDFYMLPERKIENNRDGLGGLNLLKKTVIITGGFFS